jgi:hypothetical protein
MDVAITYKRVLSPKGFEEISGDVFEQITQLPTVFPALHVVLDIQRGPWRILWVQ